MKKFKYLAMASLIVVTSLTGCTSADKPAEDNNSKNESSNSDSDNSNKSEEKAETPAGGLEGTITVQAETSWMPHYEAAAARVLEDNPNANIELIEIGSFDVFDLIDSTDITNEDVPDVFALPLDRVYGMAQNEVLAAIDSPAMAADLGGWDNFDAGLGGAFNIDGSYLAFPFNIETLIVFANTANAEAKGIDLNSKVEFSDIGYEDMLSVIHDAWFGVAFTNSIGLNLLGMDDAGNFTTDLTKPFNELTKEQQQFFETVFEYWKAHDEAGTDLWDKEAAWGYVDASFTSGGNTAIRIDGPWATPAMAEKTNGGADLAILPIDVVTVDGAPLAHWKSGWGIAVNARIEENEEQMLLAEEMIKEIVNPEYAESLFKVSGKVLENVPVETYQASGLSDMDKNVIAAMLESYGKAVSRPLFTEWGQVWGTWQNGLLSWSSVKPATVEEAYDQIQASFEAMMASI